MTESDAQEERKSEELYQLARDAYASAEKRFDDAEAKIGRYLSILFVILGLTTIGADKLRTIVAVNALPNMVFAGLIVSFYLCGVVSFSFFVRALRVQQVRTLKLGAPVFAYFQKFKLAAALSGLASAFFGAAERIRGAHRGGGSFDPDRNSSSQSARCRDTPGPRLGCPLAGIRP